VLEKYRDRVNDAVIISDEKTIGAACWYLRRNDIYLLENGGELNYGLNYPEASNRLIDIDSVKGFIEKNRVD
jgi:4-amino-4-deoxy-L-arabinose transferase